MMHESYLVARSLLLLQLSLLTHSTIVGMVLFYGSLGFNEIVYVTDSLCTFGSSYQTVRSVHSDVTLPMTHSRLLDISVSRFTHIR